MIPEFKFTAGIAHSQAVHMVKLLIWCEFEDILKESMGCFRPFGRAWHLIYETILAIFLKCSVLAEAYFAGKGLKKQCQLNGKGDLS